MELELELAPAGPDGRDGYRVNVRSAAGEVSGSLRLDPWPLIDQRRQLQASVLASAVTSRGAVTEVEVPVREVGEALFRGLFDGGVYAAYRAGLAVAAERGTQLRVVLRTQAPELAALPWEMLYDPDAGAYLCQREPLVRHVSTPSATPPLRLEPPLRVLGLVAAPRDRVGLDVDGEKRRLEAALAPLGSRVELRWAEGGRYADVQRELLAATWHVLHFVGHGGFDEHQREGVLVLEADDGTSDLVGAERFSTLLSVQVPPLQLVVLNSCAGGQSAAKDLFSSTAATLIRTDVAAVVAMQFAVSDPAAKAFAAGFYQAIAQNRSVAEAVRVGRIGIRGTSEETLEWVTPVLYLRGDDAALFDVLPDRSERAEPPVLPETAAEDAAAQALFDQATARFRTQRYDEALPLLDRLLVLRPDHPDAAGMRERALGEVQRADEAADPADQDPADQDLDGQDVVERDRLVDNQAPSPSPVRRWVAGAAVVLLLAGGALWAWPDGDGHDTGGQDDNGQDGNGGDSDKAPPAPFRSAALYAMARHHFDPDGCRVPESRADAPLGWGLPHSELLKCSSPDGSYGGALICGRNGADFATIREGYLAKAVEQPDPVPELPAGRDEPWPFQVSFVHEGGGARVFWDDAGSLCAVELQTAEPDVAAAIQHFVSGSGS